MTEIKRRPASPTRRSIAKGLVKTIQNVPSPSVTVEVLAERIKTLHSAYKDRFAELGIKLSYTSMFAWAAVERIKKFPIFRSRWEEDGSIIEFPSINIGIALGLPTGLKIPVLYEKEQRSFKDFAAALQDLFDRTATGKATPEEFMLDQATFTVNNYGAGGIADFAEPIIPYGHAGIMGFGAIKRRPIGIPDAPHTLFLTLVFDHRLMDGEPYANNFLGLVASYLENFPEEVLQI